MSSGPYPLSNSDDLLRDAAEAIGNSMDWNKTPEGHNFWNEIYYLLLNHSKAAKRNPGSIPFHRVATQPATGYQMRLIETIHVLDKGHVLCGLTFNVVIPKGHLFVTMQDKQKATCLLCKSKLLLP